MPQFSDLSDELVLMILGQVFEPAARGLLKVCIVSRRCSRLAVSVLYREISMPASKIRQDESGWESDLCRFEGNVIAHCRHLTVECELDWTLLSRLLARMRHLETVRWEYWDEPFPILIKSTLHTCWPGITLSVKNIEIGYHNDSDRLQHEDLNLLKSLVACNNMHSAEIQINYEHPISMRWLKDVLLSNRSLKILHLTVPRDEEGRPDLMCDGLGAYSLCAEEGENLESLTKLVYETRTPNGPGQWTIPSTFFNWDKLRHLELRGHHVWTMIKAAKVSDLCMQTFVLEFFCRSSTSGAELQILENFITRIRGLETLQLTNPIGKLSVATIATHGRTLKSLKIRHPRCGSDPYSIVRTVQPYLPEELDILRESCPFISTLTLDMAISDYLPYDILTAVAQFPGLIILRIYVCFIDTSRSFWRTHENTDLPHLRADRLTVQHMFKYIGSLKAGPPLDRLEVMLGDFPRKVRYRRVPTSFDRPNILFTCKRNGDGNVVIEDDVVEDNEDPAWDAYFKEDELGGPRQTYPPNLVE